MPLVITTGSRAGRAQALNAPYFPQASDLRMSNAGYPKYFQAKERTWASVTDMPLYSSRARLCGQHPQVWHTGAAFGLRSIAWKRFAGRDVSGNPGLLGRVLGAVSRNHGVPDGMGMTPYAGDAKAPRLTCWRLITTRVGGGRLSFFHASTSYPGRPSYQGECIPRHAVLSHVWLFVFSQEASPIQAVLLSLYIH